MNLTQDDLDAWRLNPVTEYLLEISRRQAATIKADILDDVWEKGEVNRARAINCQAIEQIVNDYLTATAADFMFMEENINAK